MYSDTRQLPALLTKKEFAAHIRQVVTELEQIILNEVR